MTGRRITKRVNIRLVVGVESLKESAVVGRWVDETDRVRCGRLVRRADRGDVGEERIWKLGSNQSTNQLIDQEINKLINQ